VNHKAAGEFEEERFQAAVIQSNEATLKVIGWLWRQFIAAALQSKQRQAWSLMVKPAIPRGRDADPAGQNTKADVFISKTGNGDWEPVEIKHRRNLDWTRAEDYPYSTILLDRIKTGQCDPRWYFILDRTMAHMIIVPIKSKNAWIVGMVNDRGKAGEHYEARFCPKDCPNLKWVEL
jgi:hypothetical protein